MVMEENERFVRIRIYDELDEDCDGFVIDKFISKEDGEQTIRISSFHDGHFSGDMTIALDKLTN